MDTTKSKFFAYRGGARIDYTAFTRKLFGYDKLGDIGVIGFVDCA